MDCTYNEEQKMQVSVRPSLKPSHSMMKTQEVIWSTVNEYGNNLSLKETSTHWI
jgi:hypothetical protein